MLDLFDFTFGRIPILGTVEDGVGGIVATALWGAWAGSISGN
jgi:hypothetical protein